MGDRYTTFIDLILRNFVIRSHPVNQKSTTSSVRYFIAGTGIGSRSESNNQNLSGRKSR